MAGCEQVSQVQKLGQTSTQPRPTLEESTAAMSPTLEATGRTALPTMPNTPLSVTAAITRTPTLPATKPTLALAPVTLSSLAPQDETITASVVISVTGQTSHAAVVSVNGNLVDVDTEGRFQTTVELEEGPNIIEIVASDLVGNEHSAVIRVIYEP
jgi:hypothetical protein